jgi:threonine dehydrogenase-like Zn-dependent dehydrogenase
VDRRTAARPGSGGPSMRAAILLGDGRLEVQRVPIPEPGPGEVRLRLEGCGMCGSDLPVWQGRQWFSYPREAGAPGHETWGVIDRCGAGVEGVEVGQRVAALSYHGYAEYDIAAADRIIGLGPALAQTPFPGEALGCAVNVFRRSGITSGDTVAVVGVGFLGAVVAQLAARAGARVVGISRRQRSCQLALTMGAEASFALDGDPLGQVGELTGGGLCDVVVEAAGVQGTLDVAAALVRERGRLVIAGFHQDGPRTVDMQSWNWRGIDVINAHERDPAVYLAAMAAAADAVSAGELDPAPLYTDQINLGELDRAFAAMSDPAGSTVKAIVCP